MSSAFLLGVNYPWVSCGHDFGPRPPAWANAPPQDWSRIQENLAELAAIGVRAVRWWVLAGGVNYPVGRDPRSLARIVPYLRPWPWYARPLEWLRQRRALPKTLSPFELVPALPRDTLDDFERLLAACAAARVQLIPSLASFEFFLPLEVQKPDVLTRGRAAFALGPNREAFLERVLEPLLEVSERHRDAVAMWEIVNEPDWAVRGGIRPPWVRPAAMIDLLLDGVRRVARRRFVATIGFVKADAPWHSRALRSTLRGLADRGRYVHQLHFYPRLFTDRRLPAASASPIEPCVIGELPTAHERDRFGDPDIAASEDDPARYLQARLELVAERGYAGALLWSVRGKDEHTAWSEPVRAQLARFSGKAAASRSRAATRTQ